MGIEKNKNKWLKNLVVLCWILGAFAVYAVWFGLLVGPSMINDRVGQVPVRVQEPVNLVGVPGDEIRFRILPDLRGYSSSSDGFSLRLQSSYYEVETLANVVKPGARSEGPIFGSFIVPGAPGGASLVLIGTLRGDVIIGKEHTNLEVPVSLRVIPPGEGVTTGKRERQVAWSIYFIFLGVFLVPVVFTSHLMFSIDKKWRISTIMGGLFLVLLIPPIWLLFLYYLPESVLSERGKEESKTKQIAAIEMREVEMRDEFMNNA